MAVLKKHQRLTYTPIDNQALRDETLSWKATGLLAYLLSLPDDWKINVTDLANRKTDGRTATSTAMGELEDCGYVVRTKVRDDSGRFHTTVHCAESPELLREIVDQPTLDLPTPEEPTVGKPATTKEPSPTTDIRTTQKPSIANGSLNDIKTTLVDLFGEPRHWSQYQEIATWIASCGGTPDEMRWKTGRIAEEWGVKAATAPALAKHWTRYDSEVGKLTEDDLEKYQAEVRKLNRERRAAELDAQSRGLPQ